MRVIFEAIIFSSLVASSFCIKRTVDCIPAGGNYVPVLTGSRRSVTHDISDELDVGVVEGGMSASFLNALDEVGRKIDTTNLKINMIFEQCRAQARRGLDGRLPGHCDLEDAGRCFWIVSYQNRNISMLDAWETCAERPGGRPAGIYTPAHYAKVAHLLRSKIVRPRYFTFVWLGMKIEHTTNTVYLPNGKPANFVKWLRSSYPLRNSRFNQIYFYADLKRDSGFVNFQPSRNTNGVLCESLE